MATIEEHKKEILLKRGLGKNPLITLQDLFGGSTDQKFNAFLQKAIESVLPSILKEVVDELSTKLLTDKDFRSYIAQTVVANVKQPKNGNDGITPKKGRDYFTRNDIGELILTKTELEEIRQQVLIKATPLRGIHYMTDGDIQKFVGIIQKGINLPKDGKTPSRAELLELITPLIPMVRDGSPDTGKEIVDKVNELPIEPRFQIDIKHIKGLKDPRVGKSMGISRGGLKLVWNTQLDGTINGTNTVFTVPSGSPDPKDDKFLVSARGVLKDVDSGDFTVSSDNRTITFASAPPSGSARPRIPLYHGK